jgi:chromate transporter
MTISMSVADWFSLFLHYSALAIDRRRRDQRRPACTATVDGQGWLTDPQFSASIAIAQAAPGPHVRSSLMGWNVG